MNLPTDLRMAIGRQVVEAGLHGDEEGAIEVILIHLLCTRDEAVDLYEALMKEQHMNFGREIEHGGFPTSETRTISMKRADADRYTGIGRKARFGVDRIVYPAKNRLV